MSTIEHWIGGEFTAGSSTRRAPVFNPATGEPQHEVVVGSGADVDLGPHSRPRRPALLSKLDHAAQHLTAAAFGSAGERCMAISAAVAVGGAGASLHFPAAS